MRIDSPAGAVARCLPEVLGVATRSNMGAACRRRAEAAVGARVERSPRAWWESGAAGGRMVLLLGICLTLTACGLAPKVVTTRAVTAFPPSTAKDIPVYWLGEAPYTWHDPFVADLPASEMRMGRVPAHWQVGWPERPFQVIGVVSATHPLPRSKGMARSLLQKGAQQLGADVLVGCYITSAQEVGWCCSALAARYTVPGEQPSTITRRPVVVMDNAILPYARSRGTPEFKRWAAMFAGGWAARLGRDGYYVTPPRILRNADRAYAAVQGLEAYTASIGFRPCRLQPSMLVLDARVTDSGTGLATQMHGWLGGGNLRTLLEDHQIDFESPNARCVWVHHDMPPGLELRITEGQSFRGFMCAGIGDQSFAYGAFGGERRNPEDAQPSVTYQGTDLPVAAFTGKGFLPVSPFWVSPSAAPRIGETR